MSTFPRALLPKVLRSPWALTWALMALTTASAHLLIQSPIAKTSWADWAMSLWLSALIWFSSNLCRDMISHERLRHALSCVCALLIATGLIASLVLYSRLGEFLNWGMIHYALKSGGGTMSGFTTTYLSWWHWASTAALTVALAAVWWKMPPLPLQGKKRWRALGVTLATLCASVLVTSNIPTLEIISPDSSLLMASVEAAIEPGSEPLAQGPPLSPPAPSDPLQAPPDILLIIHESLGTHDLSWYGGKPGAMPWLESQVSQDDTSWIVVPQAYTVSTTTHLSVPSIWSGIHPTRDLPARSKAPLLWQWAKSAGYQTVLVSAQCYSWGEFDAFIDRAPPDHFLGCDQHPDAKPVNDAGIDELLVAQGVKSVFETLDPHTPLLMVYNSNALHQPFQTASTRWAGSAAPDGSTDYQKALKLVDHALSLIESAALHVRPNPEGPVILMTADHGERTHAAHRIPRVESYHEEFVRIPMLWRMPSRLQTPAFQASLKQRNISNLDILPSLIRLMGHNPATAPVALDGRNLIDGPMPADRMLLVTNNAPSRRWHHHGELLIQGPNRLIVSDLTGTKLYDIRQGRAQTPAQELGDADDASSTIKAMQKKACDLYGTRSSICTAR